jgi:hypothetical protein
MENRFKAPKSLSLKKISALFPLQTTAGYLVSKVVPSLGFGTSAR